MTSENWLLEEDEEERIVGERDYLKDRVRELEKRLNNLSVTNEEVLDGLKAENADLYRKVEEHETALKRSNEEFSKLKALNEVLVRRLNGIQHELTAAGEEAERL